MNEKEKIVAEIESNPPRRLIAERIADKVFACEDGRSGILSLMTVDGPTCQTNVRRWDREGLIALVENVLTEANVY